MKSSNNSNNRREGIDDNRFYATKRLSNFDLAQSKKLKRDEWDRVGLNRREVEEGRDDNERNKEEEDEYERQESLINAKKRILSLDDSSDEEEKTFENNNTSGSSSSDEEEDSGNSNGAINTMIGLKQGESSFEIPELRPGGSYSKDHHPNREDGKTWSLSDYKNHPYYNSEYMEDEDARRKILESNPDYIFITAVAGHLNVHNVEKLYQMDDVSGMMRRDAFMRRQQDSLLQDSKMNRLHIRNEIKSLQTDIDNHKGDISRVSNNISIIDGYFSDLREMYRNYMEAYLFFKEAHHCREALRTIHKPKDIVDAIYYTLQATKRFRDDHYTEFMEIIIEHKLEYKSDDMDSDQLDEVYKEIENDIEEHHKDKTDKSYTQEEYEKWVEVIKLAKISQYKVPLGGNSDLSPSIILNRLVPKLRNERSEQLGRLCGLVVVDNQILEDDDGQPQLMQPISQSYASGIIEVLDSISDTQDRATKPSDQNNKNRGNARDGVRFLLDSDTENFRIRLNTIIENVKQHLVLFLSAGGNNNNNQPPPPRAEEMNLLIEEMNKFIKNFIKKSTSATQYNDNMKKVQRLLVLSKQEIEKSVESSDGNQLLSMLYSIRVYLEHEKIKLEIELEKYIKQLENLKARQRDITSGKVNPNDIEYPYRQRRGWVDSPQHSGVVKIVPPVVAAIEKAYSDLCLRVDGALKSSGGNAFPGYGGSGGRLNYSSVPIEQLQRLPEIYNLFAELVAVHVSKSMLRSNNQYFPQSSRMYNAKDHLDIIQKFKNHYYVTSSLNGNGGRVYSVVRVTPRSNSIINQHGGGGGGGGGFTVNGNSRMLPQFW